MDERNYDDPIYKKARVSTLKRDRFMCQWPNCRSNKQLRVHHIRTWAEHPSLRFILNNLITLCKYHHDMIWGKEEDYERMFFQIIKRQSDDKRRKKQTKSRVAKSSKRNIPEKDKSYAQKYAEAKRKARKGRK
jgi:5-methylcytosine-specific restriction endonuclease McrA